jgi:hypothetical protein
MTDEKMNICKTCGFDKALIREPIILTGDPISLICYFEEEKDMRCPECGHWKSGYTIIGDNPIGRLNAEWKGKINKIHERFERQKNDAVADWLESEEAARHYQEKEAEVLQITISENTIKADIAVCKAMAAKLREKVSK